MASVLMSSMQVLDPQVLHLQVQLAAQLAADQLRVLGQEQDALAGRQGHSIGNAHRHSHLNVTEERRARVRGGLDARQPRRRCDGVAHRARAQRPPMSAVVCSFSTAQRTASSMRRGLLGPAQVLEHQARGEDRAHRVRRRSCRRAAATSRGPARTGSACPGWMLPEAAMPRPPCRPAPRSVTMSPNMFEVTITSNCCGSRTSCSARLST